MVRRGYLYGVRSDVKLKANRPNWLCKNKFSRKRYLKYSQENKTVVLYIELINCLKSRNKGVINFYRYSVHSEIYTVHSQTYVLIIKLGKV